MCEQILLALAEPCQYRILELSADLRGRQQDYLQARLPGELFDRIDWLEALPTEFDGIVLGNEVLDAMPVHLLRKDRDWYELGVGFDGRRFCWRRYTDDSEAVSTMQLIESSREILADGYTSEINLNYRPWLAGLRDACNQVIVLMIDYGYPQEQYYHPERSGGTLVCHYHHRVHYDPLIYPGLQDVTASVDFDAFADAALLCGFDICGLTTQARFLLANGLLEEAACAELEMNTKSQLELAQQIKTLSLPGEMGDRFKVIGLQKNMDIEIVAFSSRRFVAGGN
jgi:SAM-dependent MidA family methyltransferase